MGCRRAAVCLAAAPICGVASDRVYICTQLPAMPVSFYLAFPSVPHFREVGYFCCTFPEVSLGGRYPLSCPSMPGLSSRQYLSATWRAAAPPASIIIAECRGFVNLAIYKIAEKSSLAQRQHPLNHIKKSGKTALLFY